MPRKPPTFKGRVPKLSRSERQTEPTGAFHPPLLPDGANRSKEDAARARQLETILAASESAIDFPPLFAALSDALDLWRDREDELANALPLSEEERYAGITADAYEQAVERGRHAPPSVAAMAEGIHWARTGRRFAEDCVAVDGPMSEIAATWRAVADRLASLPPRSGPTPNPARGAALRAVRDALVAHSTPTMTPARARTVAAELLSACGVPMPSAPHELRKLENSR